MIHYISRFIAALALLATAQGVWADGHVSCRVIIQTPTNGTITVTRNDTHATVTSGDVLPEGTTVTVNATPADGYDLKELRLTTYTYGDAPIPGYPPGWVTDGASLISNGATFTIEENKEYIFIATFDQNVVKYSITKNITGQGTLDVTSESVAGNRISVGYTPGDGYRLESLTVTKADNSNVSVTYDAVKDKYYFTMPEANVTINAVFSATAFFVRFNANGGTGTMADQTIPVGETQALTANAFTREGYVFAGWSDTTDGSVVYANGQSVTNLAAAGETFNLYAQWTATYTVHFNANGGTGTMDDQTIAVGATTNLTANAFTRDGYYFEGWNTQTDGLGTNYADGASVTNLTTTEGATFNLYAQWRETVTADYVDASGNAHTLSGCKEITPDHMPTTLSGNYIVSESVTYTSKVTLSGNTTIVLANGKTMSIGTEAAPLGGDYAIYASGTNGLTIYGQSLDAATAGRLEVYSTGYSAVKLYDGSYTQHSGNVVVSRSGGSNNNYAINAGGSVTIDGGKLDASINSEGSFAINANGNISISGGSVTANATGADSYGMRAVGNITLGWTKPTDRISITASSYSGTVAVADGKMLHNGSDYLGGTLSDPATAVNGKTLRPAATATYTTADGTAATADAILLDASDNSLPAGNYLATGTLNYTHGITLAGDVTLILADNCHMNVGTSGEGRINDYGFFGFSDGSHSITITSQSLGDDMGALSVYTTGMNKFGILANAITIDGGNVTADTNGDRAIALYAGGTDLTINGGTVTATTAGTDAHAIYAIGDFKYNGGNVTATATGTNANAICATGGNYTFSWRTPADRITIGATGLYAPADKTATFARLFTDAADPADNYYGGTYTGDALNALAGKTLSGTTEVTLTEDNATQALAAINGMSGISVTFNRAFTARKPSTICLPFDYTKKEGDGSFYAFTSIEHSGGKYIATMTEPGTTTLTANTPYLYLPSATGNVEFSGTPTTAIAAGTTTSGDWTFQGTYDEVKWDTAPTGIYGFSAQNVSDQDISQGEFVKVGAKVRIRPLRAYLKYKNGTENYSAAPTRGTTADLPDRIIVRLIGSDGNTTAIGTLDTRTGEVEIDTWYDLNGRKLSAKPTHRGIYINNGRKVAIK